MYQLVRQEVIDRLAKLSKDEDKIDAVQQAVLHKRHLEYKKALEAKRKELEEKRKLALSRQEKEQRSRLLELKKERKLLEAAAAKTAAAAAEPSPLVGDDEEDDLYADARQSALSQSVCVLFCLIDSCFMCRRHFLR